MWQAGAATLLTRVSVFPSLETVRVVVPTENAKD